MIVWVYPGSHDLNSSNRPVRTRMPGGVAGARSAMIGPYADARSASVGAVSGVLLVSVAPALVPLLTSVLLYFCLCSLLCR